MELADLCTLVTHFEGIYKCCSGEADDTAIGCGLFFCIVCKPTHCLIVTAWLGPLEYLCAVYKTISYYVFCSHFPSLPTILAAAKNILILTNKEDCRQSMKSGHILAKGPCIVALRQEEKLL